MEESSIITPPHAPRTLVLCFDGTNDKFDADNSNVVQFFRLLERDDRSKQMVYYQTGIGTYTSPQLGTALGRTVWMTLDKMVAWNLSAHVIDGYEFLMENYVVGDKICLFGFSRGAYTARALAGMLHSVGLLPPGNHQQVPFAYKMYKSAGDLENDQCKEFKDHFSINVDIEFIGVWDTVCSVGIFPRHLPFATSNDAIRVFRHALSLDERRVKFQVNHYHTPVTPEVASERWSKLCKKLRTAWQIFLCKKGNCPHEDGRTLDESESDEKKPETNVKEVWFAGCHRDVGGGSVRNDKRHSLARIPLRWMICECFRANTGIRFNAGPLRKIGLNPTLLSPSSPHLPDNELEDDIDAVCSIHDKLSCGCWQWLWWTLEVVPIKLDENEKWWKLWKYRPNLGRGRTVPPTTKNFYIHRSVKTRREANLEGGRYKPKATSEVLEPTIDKPQPVNAVAP